MKMRHFRSTLLRAAIVLAPALAAGCKTWEAVPEAPAIWIARQAPQEVRLTAETGARVTIKHPIVAGDSIVSAAFPIEAGPFAPPRPGVLASDVAVVERSRFSALKTAAFGAGILAVSIIWARNAGTARGGGAETPKPPEPKLRPGFVLGWRGVP